MKKQERPVVPKDLKPPDNVLIREGGKYALIPYSIMVAVIMFGVSYWIYALYKIITV